MSSSKRTVFFLTGRSLRTPLTVSLRNVPLKSFYFEVFESAREILERTQKKCGSPARSTGSVTHLKDADWVKFNFKFETPDGRCWYYYYFYYSDLIDLMRPVWLVCGR